MSNWNGKGQATIGEMVQISGACIGVGNKMDVEVTDYKDGYMCYYSAKYQVWDSRELDKLVVKPIPDPKQIARDAMVFELAKLFGDCLTDIEAAEAMISKGYRKLNPLPKSWLDDYNEDDGEYLVSITEVKEKILDMITCNQSMSEGLEQAKEQLACSKTNFDILYKERDWFVDELEQTQKELAQEKKKFLKLKKW